ncbi:MAG: MopE-related protein, partial [Pseudomonadota bacterium]|nr:MopE-related protein [Pseudomonadota bacterium]
MRGLLLLLLPTFVAGCGTTWTLRDEDGDGKSILDGDCADSPDGGGEVGPEAAEIWYDGIDQNCDGLSDFDQDGDGFDAAGTGDGTDCWDDPNVIPEAFEAINGFGALTAASVNPDALEVYYDGVDANCDGLSDFDQDLDGFDTSNGDYRQPDGSLGDDCYDSVEADEYPESGTVTEDFEPADVYPGASDTWYDGTDSNCDGQSDYDQDGDGYNLDGECDDLNADIFPDPTVPEVWYNDFDENCDGNLYDKDLDGHASADHGGDDCWDDFDSIPADFVAINGRTQPPADAVFPGAEDAWYDAVDADCAGDSDFDRDLDGFDTDELPARSGTTGTDCEDEDAEAYPGASEIWYNGVDNDCDGLSDYDADGDGFDSEDEISTGTDCDDVRELVNTAMNEDCGTTYDDNCDGGDDLLDATDCVVFYYDGDSDTFGTTATECWCEAQTATGYDAANSTDCDDTSNTDYPGATETVANSDDEDCDGFDSCYADADNDNYGTTTVVVGSSLNCTTGTGAPVATDCDDSSNTDYPGASEIVANSDDEDCDGFDSCYTDVDNDNYGTTVVMVGSSLNCTTGTGAPVSTDCDDASNTDYPGATETVANSDDEDCDGFDSCYTDVDNDNYGTTVVMVGSSLNCTTGTGAPVSTDCDDASNTDYPGATETVANNDDEDCDGFDSCYTDADNDNYGTAVVIVGSSLSCTTGTGAPVATDCNDAASTINPGATEVVGDGVSQDCDADETCFVDADSDGYRTINTALTVASIDADCTDAGEG